MVYSKLRKIGQKMEKINLKIKNLMDILTSKIKCKILIYNYLINYNYLFFIKSNEF